MIRRLAIALTCLLFSAGALAAATRASQEQELNQFIKGYVDATNSHDFANVQPLLLPTASYWFNKETHDGIAAVKASFERTWSYLPDEVYGIENVRWLSIDDNSAACVYEYTFRGSHEGTPMKGRGRGTSVLVRQDGKWRIAHEHLFLSK